jgi:hypothetical protein
MKYEGKLVKNVPVIMYLSILRGFPSSMTVTFLCI